MSKEAKPDAWMPLYIGDWDGDTAHLDCERDGAYGRLIRHYWRNGPLADDDASLARIVRMDLKRWKKQIRPVLAPFFRIEHGLWNNNRADKEILKWSGKKAAAAEKARIAAAKRWNKDAPSTPQALLGPCPSTSSREVDAPTGQSTLSAEDSISDLKKASLDEERGWAIDAQRAEDELILARRTDPDRASELAEFIATARANIADLRRARLSIVVAA